MDDTVVKTVRSVTKIGEKQSNSFANEQFVCLLHNLSRRIIFPLYVVEQEDRFKRQDESGSFEG